MFPLFQSWSCQFFWRANGEVFICQNWISVSSRRLWLFRRERCDHSEATAAAVQMLSLFSCFITSVKTIKTYLQRPDCGSVRKLKSKLSAEIEEPCRLCGQLENTDATEDNVNQIFPAQTGSVNSDQTNLLTVTPVSSQVLIQRRQGTIRGGGDLLVGLYLVNSSIIIKPL